MTTRAESAAATRRALLHAAGALLDAGGPDAVTLREVGAMAGVSRSAPYRHFNDKDALLTVLATQAWHAVGDDLQLLVPTSNSDSLQLLRTALVSMLKIGRSRPHLYRLMFSTPTGDPTAAVRAAERAQDLFLPLVAAIVGQPQARAYAGLLLITAHGISGLETSGHLGFDKWQSTPEGFLDLLLTSLPQSNDKRG